MFSRTRIMALFAGAFSLVWLIGFSYADAQQPMPNPATRASSPTPTPTPPPIEDDEVIKVDSEIVNLLFTAQDRNRRLLTSLTAQDVKILENGQPQEVTTFSRQIDLPLSLAILID